MSRTVIIGQGKSLTKQKFHESWIVLGHPQAITNLISPPQGKAPEETSLGGCPVEAFEQIFIDEAHSGFDYTDEE
jgi:hypothetical protein